MFIETINRGGVYMNKNIKSNVKKIAAYLLIGTVIGTGLLGKNMINSKAEETNKYVRANNIAVDNNGELVITRNELGNTPMGKEDSWTVLVYICGSDLESWGGSATTDIKEMVAAGTNENVNIILQTGGATEWQDFNIKSNKIERYIVKEDGIEKIQSLKNASMAEASTLSDFVEFGVKNYPAEHMGMIYWNHGGGSIYGACSDENYEGMLTLSEFEMALSEATKDMTDKFEFIGFDACLMATLETANTFVPFADYMIASEESESAEGWDYTALVNKLVQNPDIDVVSLGKEIVDSFVQCNIDAGTEDMTTLSLTDLSKIDAVLVEFNKVAKKMWEMGETKEDITLFTRLAYAAENYSEGSGFNMIDFTDYMLNLEDLIPEAVNVAKLMEEAVVYERHGEVFMDTKGLSFYYCYGNMNMSDMNILRNITVSPYFMNFIEKVAYGATHDGSLEGFVSNNWENNEYYYDKNYDFVKYEFQEMLDYSEALSNEAYFVDATFDEVWYDWFKGFDEYREYEDSDEYFTDEDLEYIDEDAIIIDTGLDINLEFGSGIELHGVTLTNNSPFDLLRNVAKASYKVVVNNGTSMNVVGDLGTIGAEAKYNGKWFALSDGSLIAADKINEGNGIALYRANVLLDGVESFVYFLVDKKDNVLILASWSGMNEENKSAGRIMSKLEGDAKIAPIYTTVDYTNGKIIKSYGKEVVANGKFIKVVELNDCSFAVESVDAFGKESYSMPIDFE